MQPSTHTQNLLCKSFKSSERIKTCVYKSSDNYRKSERLDLTGCVFFGLGVENISTTSLLDSGTSFSVKLCCETLSFTISTDFTVNQKMSGDALFGHVVLRLGETMKY